MSRISSGSRSRPLAVGLIALAVGLLAVFLVLYFQRGVVPGDAIVYLAGGERLNAGHPLYAISPGDRPIGIQPPHWTVPLLSPPFIAVVFRPLALLPPDAGAYIWWVGTLVAIAYVLIAYLRARPIVASIGILVLLVPLTYEIGVGNVNGLLLLGTVLVWRWTLSGREARAGATTALMVMVKLSPVVLAWWLITQRRWTAIRAGIAVGVVLCCVSLLGAGIEAHLRFLEVTRDTTTIGTSTLSLAGMARWAGVAPSIAAVLPAATTVVGILVVFALRAHPGLAFAAAVATMTLGSPVVNINSFALLLGCLAPAIWPAPSEAPATRPVPVTAPAS